jgi:quercetin dioxygenase-like cupin family protein
MQRGHPDRRTALFGGQGSVTVWDLLGADAAAPFSAVLACELEAGGRVGKHRQQSDPELVIGLQGSGEAVVDGRNHALGSGDVVYLGLGQALEIRNLSATEPLRYLIVKARLP